MDELVKSLKVSLATVFAFYLKAQNYHWNVEGADFYQYHTMFQKIYEDVQESVDGFGEQVRTLNSYAPASFVRFGELSLIADETKIPTGVVMVDRLIADNATVIEQLNATLKLAEENNKQGLMNFIAGRLEQHEKWAYFLRSTKRGD